MLQQLADDRGNGVGGGSRADGLKIPAGAERAAYALDHEHPYIVGRFDFRAKLLELLRDRKINGVERGRPVERDRGDRTIEAEQGRIVR